MYKPPTPTSMSLIASFSSTDSYPYVTYYDVSAGIDYDIGHQLIGEPITYTIMDATTRRKVGSFAGTSNLYATCTVVASLNYPQDTVETLTGQAVVPYSGCPLAAVSLPAADTALLTVSFAGNSTYAPSVSDPTAF